MAMLLLAAAPAAAATPAPAGRPDASPLFTAALITLEGKPATLASLRGRPMLVNFWARWCTPCRTEIPQLVRARRRHPGIHIVGIDVDEPKDAVREFVQAYEMNYQILIAPEHGVELLRALDNPNASLPYTLAIDRRGKVVGRKLGVMSRTDLEALLGAARR